MRRPTSSSGSGGGQLFERMTGNPVNVAVPMSEELVCVFPSESGTHSFDIQQNLKRIIGKLIAGCLFP